MMDGWMDGWMNGWVDGWRVDVLMVWVDDACGREEGGFVACLLGIHQ